MNNTRSYWMLWTAACFVVGCAGEDAPPETVTETVVQYVGSDACVECHTTQAEQWSGSDHDLAMQVASDETVLGTFDDVTFSHRGMDARFYRQGDSFYVHTTGPGGTAADFPVKYTFGVDPLQQYLVDVGGGRLQAFSVAWDVQGKKWFHLHPDEDIPPGDELHWTSPAYNWNSRCASCHSTNLEKNYNPEDKTYDTTWSDIDVSCEACHGPASKHLEWARLPVAGRPADVGLIDLAFPDPRVEVETCAPCHSRRVTVDDGFRPGDDYSNYYSLQLIDEGFYYPDGQILDEVFVYGSFLQSKMHARGVRCTDCHNPHTLKLKVEGDGLCLQCHQQRPNNRFPSLTLKRYDTPDHHFHPMESDGARCVNCHMPATTYMVIDPRRDHSFKVPQPDLTMDLGTPNACNRCHDDQPAVWAAQTVAMWYPTAAGRDASAIARAIAGGRNGDAAAENALAGFAENGGVPPIFRATAVRLLARYPAQSALDAALAALDDDAPLVRASAVATVGLFATNAGPNADRRAMQTDLIPRLSDGNRLVRIEAARILAGVPATVLDVASKRALEKALGEYREVQNARADWPDSYLHLGVLDQNLGDVQGAEREYLEAIDLDPNFLPVRFNLANLYNAMGRNDDAEEQLREVVARRPDSGEAHYSLGLLLAEMGRLDEAIVHFSRAAELMPTRARVRYNYALALQRSGRRSEAESVLLQAYERAPEDPSIARGLAVFYAQDEDWARAELFARRVLALAPNDPTARDIIRQRPSGTRR